MILLHVLSFSAGLSAIIGNLQKKNRLGERFQQLEVQLCYQQNERSDIQTQQTERVFRYSGVLVLPDPDPRLGIEAVRLVYASSYPEIITASVTGPELADGKQVFTFKTAVGAKS